MADAVVPDRGHVQVVLAQALVALFPGCPMRLTVTAASVSQLIDALDQQWPGMADRLRDSAPAVRRHINVFCEGRRLVLADPLTPGATVYILTSVSGG